MANDDAGGSRAEASAESVSSRGPVNRKRREGAVPQKTVPVSGPQQKPAGRADQRYGEGSTIRIGAALASLTTSVKPVTLEA
jgi:hypothetical protein